MTALRFLFLSHFFHDQECVRPLVVDRDPKVITELALLDFKFFDDIRIAKQVAESYGLTYIDLSKAKISDKMLKLIRKSEIIKYRVLPIQKNSKAVSLAIFDPSLMKIQSELQSLFQYPAPIRSVRAIRISISEKPF